MYAERCPTAAWDMQKFFYDVNKAGEVKYGCNGHGSRVSFLVRTGSGSDWVIER